MNKKQSTKRSEKDSVKNEIDVSARLAEFHIIPSRRARTFLTATPALLFLLILMDWLVGSGAFSRDTFRMTGILTVAISLISIRILFEQLPNALNTIWKRGIISDTKKDAKPFLNYLDRLKETLNSKFEGLFVAVFAAGGLLATYPFRNWIVGLGYPFDIPTTIVYYFGGQAAVIAPILGALFGILVWRVGVIAYYIGALGDQFHLKIQVNHLDKSGGLKPLGNLAFNIAIIIVIPAIFFAIWGFITAIFSNPSLQGYIVLWGGLYRQLLAALVAMSFFAFVQPLYKIHKRMENYAQTVQDELDALSNRIEILSHELRTQADELTPEQGQEKLSSIEFMKKVYEENSNIPTWPFDTRTFLQFISAQVVPVLSLIGTSGPMIDIVRGIFEITR